MTPTTTRFSFIITLPNSQSTPYSSSICPCSLALECKVISFEDGILIGEIVNVCADEYVITDGKIDPKKLKPIAFDPCISTYTGLGEVVGKAFGDGLNMERV